MEVVQNGAFNGLVRLQTLSLYKNKLTAVPSLNPVKSTLRSFSVTNNRISSLSALKAGVSGCNSLKGLSFSGNFFAGELDLPALPNLEHLKASSNQLTSLKQGLLEGFPKLSELDLEINQIAALNYDFPETVTTLKLKENSIETIGAGTFRNMNSSEALDLSQNQIKRIEDGAFEGMDSLASLSVAENQLSYVPNMMEITDTLESLDLSKNRFNISALEDLVQFVHLDTLDVAYCGLNGSLTLPPLSNLTDLDLGYNRLTNIETGDLLKFTKLHTLMLNNNYLKTLFVPTDFPVTLNELSLNSNDYEDIPADAFGSLANPSRITKLHLSHNNIRFIDEGAFNGLSSLTELYIAHNSVTTIPNLSPCINSLKILHVGYNPLHVIDKTRLVGFNRLEKLVATQTLLNGTVDLPTLPALKELLLDKNSFSDISTNLFRGFNQLTKVILSDNKFDALPIFERPPGENTRVAIPRSVTFVFKNNRLTTVKENWLFYVSQWSKFDLTYNDIVCDWRLCWMSDCGHRVNLPYELVMPACRGGAWNGVAWKNVNILQLCPRKYCIDSFVQDCSNSSALVMELLQSFAKPSVCPWNIHIVLS